MIGRSVLITVAIIAVILVSLVPPIAADTRTTVFYPSSYLDGSGDVRDVLAGDADWWAPYDSTGRVGVTAKCAALGAAHAWAYRYLAYKAAATGLATIEVTIEYTGGGYTAGTGWSVLNTLLWVDVWRPPTTQPGLDFVEGSVSVLIPGESWNDILQSAYDALDTKLAQYEGNPSVVHTHTMRKSFQFEQNRWYVIAAGLDAAVTGCLGGAGIKMMGKVKSITVTEYEAPQALPDWTIALYPDALNLLRDGSATSTITLASLNQFEGAVYFSSPEYPAADIDVSINPTSVHLSSGGTVTAKLSVSAGSHALTGTWTFKITATGGGETHSADITVTVKPPPPDFTITLYPASIEIPRGKSATSTITLASLNQFEGAVYFSSPEYPAADIDVSINPTSVHLSSGGTVTAKLSVSAGSHALTGTWTFKITATGGGETHSADITIIVPRRA